MNQFGGIYSYMNALGRTWSEPNNAASLQTNDNHDPFYPGCLLFDNAAELGQQQGCAFLRLFRRSTFHACYHEDAHTYRISYTSSI